jgi:H+/Cl- antiporter ClcA
VTTQPSDGQEPARAIVGLLVLAAAAGLAASVGVVAFLSAEHHLHALVWSDLPELFGADGAIPAWYLFVVLLVGAVGVHLALRLPGHGAHRPLDGLGFDIGPRAVVSVVVAALLSLTAGAVLGPEAPLMAVGSAVGALVARRLPPDARHVLMMAGATAAITLILGNPLVAGVLVLEGLVLKGAVTGRRAVVLLMAVLVAMGFGYLAQVGVGGWPGIGESQLAVPGLPAYPAVAWADILLALPVAVVTGIAGVLAVRVGGRVQRAATARPLPVLLGSAVLIATVAALATLQSGVTYDLVLFSGQQAIPAALGLTSVAALLVILVAKVLAYGLSLGAGFRGGQVFPAVYIGVVVGLLATQAVGSANESAAVATGIAAGAAAVLRMPFTSVLLALLLTSAAGLAVTTPAIIGAVVGLLVRAAIDARIAPPAAPGSTEDLVEHRPGVPGAAGPV